MADSTILNLPAASYVNATDFVPIDQNGATLKATMLQVSQAKNAVPVWFRMATGFNLTITGGQTLVPLIFTYTQNTNTIQVILNGATLVSGQDFTETSPTSITLASPLVSTDTLVILGLPTVAFAYSVTDSTQVRYVPTGTGAVATTVAGKLQNTQINAADFLPNGYDVTGATDYTTQIQAAINYASSVKSPLVFPAGTFKGNWIVSSETYISGQSRNGTIFIPSTNAPVFQVNQSASTVRLRFEKFTITGNLASNAQDGISLFPASTYFVDTVYIHDVSINSCGRYGLYTYGTSSAGPFVQNLRVDFCTISGCVAQGFFANGFLFETVFTNVWCTNNGSKSVPNVTLGSGTNGPYRFTWIGGGMNQATLNTNSPPRLITDLVTTATSATATSATANFTNADTGTTIAIANGNTFGQPLITTITYVNSTTITLGAVANVTNAGGTRAIINCSTSTGGMVQINGTTQSIKFLGCDMENATQFFTVTGSNNQNIGIETCNMGGSVPSISLAWLQGNGDEFELRNCNAGNSAGYLYVGLVGSNTGALIALAGQYRNINIQPPVTPPLIQNLVVFDYQSIGSVVANTLRIYQRDIEFIRINGAGTLNQLFDSIGGTGGLRRGQKLVLYASSGTTVVTHGLTPAGSIYMQNTASLNLPAGSALTLRWDDVNNIWFEDSVSALPSAAAMITSSVSFNTGTAAQTATMTNGPTAGNPTKWIPVNDNGTTRYIPAW